MHFHRKQRHLDEYSVVTNGREIYFNFLGIMLDENLSWKNYNEMDASTIFKLAWMHSLP